MAESFEYPLNDRYEYSDSFTEEMAHDQNLYISELIELLLKEDSLASYHPRRSFIEQTVREELTLRYFDSWYDEYVSSERPVFLPKIVDTNVSREHFRSSSLASLAQISIKEFIVDAQLSLATTYVLEEQTNGKSFAYVQETSVKDWQADVARLMTPDDYDPLVNHLERSLYTRQTGLIILPRADE